MGIDMTNDRLNAGKNKYDELQGPGAGERLAGVFAVGSDLARFGLELNYGDIYTRPLFDMKQRQLLTIASLVTLGGVDRALQSHIGGALNAGATPEEVAEVIIHTVQYSGFPRAMNAMVIANAVFAERSKEKAPD